MEIAELNRRQNFLVVWSPLLLVLSLLWLILSLWRGPIFPSYLIACAALGLLYGGVVILNYWKELSTLSTLGMVIFIAGEKLAKIIFIGDIPYRVVGWSVLSQYFSIVLISFFSLAWLFRQRILKQDRQ